MFAHFSARQLAWFCSCTAVQTFPFDGKWMKIGQLNRLNVYVICNSNEDRWIKIKYLKLIKKRMKWTQGWNENSTIKNDLYESENKYLININHLKTTTVKPKIN